MLILALMQKSRVQNSTRSCAKLYKGERMERVNHFENQKRNRIIDQGAEGKEREKVCLDSFFLSV